MKTPPLLAITLDLDDTLWPARPTLLHAEQVLAGWLAAHAPGAARVATPAWRRATREAIARDHPDRLHDLGFMRRENLCRALREAGEPEHLAGAAFEVFLAARQNVTLYEDVAAVLEAWSARYRLVALSNGNADIERIGLGRFFHASVSAHLAGVAKPDARIFHAACREAGVEPVQTLHIGDDLDLDVRAARAAGLRAAWLRRPDLPMPPQAGDIEPIHADLLSIEAHLRPEV